MTARARRTRRSGGAARVATATAAVLVAAGAISGLAACGSNKTTVSAPPSSTIAPPPIIPRSGEGGAPDPQSTGGNHHYTEAPATVASTEAGYSSAVVGAREQGYLDVLRGAGIKTDDLSDALVAAGNTICKISTTGGPANEMTTIADAVAGQVVSGGYAPGPEAAVARTVTNAATQKLCP